MEHLFVNRLFKNLYRLSEILVCAKIHPYTSEHKMSGIFVSSSL